jgi:hypothetical protein
MSRWNNDLAIFCEVFVPVGILVIQAPINAAARMRFWRKEVSKRIGVRARRGLVDLVRFDKRHVIDEDLFVDDLHTIARQTNGSLHVVLREILRILETMSPR